MCELSPQVFCNWFTYIHDVHSYATRSSTNIICDNYFDSGTEESTYSLYISESRLVMYGDRLVKVYGSRIWNKIPFFIQDATSIVTFKQKLKKHFLSQYRN